MSHRLPVTVAVLKYIHRKLESIKWICTLLWGGAMSVHEALAEDKYDYYDTSTLLLEDVNFCDAKVDGKWQKLLKVKLKCPKESSVGNGVVIEVFNNNFL